MPNNPNDSMTRRQLLIAAGAGAIGVAATAYGLTQTSDEARAQFERELNKLRTLIGLYEQMDRIGLDNILANGLSLMRGLFEALKTGIRLMRDGVTIAEKAWQGFQAALIALRTTVDRIAQMAGDLQQKFKAAEGLVVGAIGVALPLAESIASFFNSLLSKIPFVGEDLRRTANSLVELVRAIPALIEAVTAQLLKQLNDLFFQPTGKARIDLTLIDPITVNLLEPLKKFLGDLDMLITKWEKEFVFPVQSALDERRAVKKQIAEYRQQYNV
ncbi:MAG: hypothetical protein HY868_23835 [Chloroflexi bacterium]|nr:hypothetical protein [Chloroflexota bacterium]